MALEFWGDDAFAVKDLCYAADGGFENAVREAFIFRIFGVLLDTLPGTISAHTLLNRVGNKF